jgi:thiamine-phosphate pyrophosphorylase
MSLRTAKLERAAAAFPESAGLPRLWFFTDPARTSDPICIAGELPAGTAVVYRHFGAGDRHRTAGRLARLCRRRELHFIVGDDDALATEVGAEGVHLPERRAAEAPAVRRAHPAWLITVAAHSATAVRSARGVDACVLSPVSASRSPSAGAPMKPAEIGAILRGARVPVIALGGVKLADAPKLARTGFAGAAGIDMFLE